MSFYSKYMGSLMEMPDHVQGDGFELLAQNRSDYTYPVNGWYWFDTLEEANETLNQTKPPIITVEAAKQFVQKLLDETAASKGYGDERTSPSIAIVSYSDDANAVFATEAKDFKKWRSEVWSSCITYLAEIEAGHSPPPGSFEELRSKLPVIVWSAVAPAAMPVSPEVIA